MDINSTGTAAANGTVGAEVTGTSRAEIAATLAHGSWETGDTTSAATVDITPDVAGTYTVLVSTSVRTQAVATSTYTAGDASATYTFSTGATVASVTLAALTGAVTGGSTYGQIFKVTIKDAAGAATQLASGEAINITSNVSTTNVGEITGGCTSSCTPTYNGAGVTAGLDNTNFSGGVAYIQIKDGTAAAADAVITATGSGLLANTITGTVAFSTVLGTAFASAVIADPTSAVRPGSGKVGVSGTYADTTSTASTSHSYNVTVATAVATAKNVSMSVADTYGQITGLVGAVYGGRIALAATTGLGTLSVSTPLGMTAAYTFAATVETTTPATITVTSAASVTSGSTIAVEPN